MPVSIQIYGGCIRDHGEGDWGDPYAWCCGFMSDPLDPSIAILGGTMTAPKLATIRRMLVKFERLGFKTVRYVEGGLVIEHEIAVLGSKLSSLDSGISRDNPGLRGILTTRPNRRFVVPNPCRRILSGRSLWRANDVRN